jgi:hypothetical protein
MAKKPHPFESLPHLHVPIFGGHIYMATGRKAFLAAHAELRRLNRVERPAPDLTGNLGVTSYFENEQGAVGLIGVFGHNRTTLIHELAHCTFDVLDRAGVETGEGNRETFCYLLDTLYAHFAPFLRAKKDKS